jgi:lipid II:glycine glycyltransferase (peptidoglycan interpeptide bridge formation enzyme)
MSAPPCDMDRWKNWDRFLEAEVDTGFMQTSWWAMFRAAVGYEYFCVTIKDADTIVGGALVAKWSYAPQRCFYYMQDGPVLPKEEDVAGEVFNAILRNVEEHRKAERETVSHLRIEPRWHCVPRFVRGFQPLAFGDPYSEPRNTLCIDLRPPEGEILAQMKPKGRYNICVARRHGVSVVEDTSAQGLVDFIRIQRRTAMRQGIEAKPPSYFRNLLAAVLPPGKVSLFFAEHRGRRLAAALVVYFGRRATYFFGGSLAVHRSVMAPYLLHFEIMRTAKASGCDWYDFWGVAPRNEPGHPWHSISVFKRKFGGVEIKLVPTLDYVYDRAAYDDYAGTHDDPRPARLPENQSDMLSIRA